MAVAHPRLSPDGMGLRPPRPDMSIEQRARRLLERMAVLEHPSDLDLLIFFARHPHSLLSSEHLAALLGYDIKLIAASLDLLVAAGLVTRTQSARHAARLFVLSDGGTHREWFPDLLTIASNREGRLALLELLRAPSAADRPASENDLEEAGSPTLRPFLVSGKRAAGRRSKTG
jgi:hypothetical protein